MIKLGFLGNLYFHQENVKQAINSELAKRGYPGLGDLYRVCPKPRVEVNWFQATLTVYLQYLPGQVEIPLVMRSSEPTNVTVGHIKEANPWCL